jgi:tape measure domain-containing protein
MRAADFTTFITAVQDPAVDRKFDRLASTGIRAFSQITNAAKAASNAVDLAISGRGGLGSRGTQSLREQANAAIAAAQASERLSRTTPAVTNAQRANATATALQAREYQGLIRNLNATSTALAVVQGPLGPIAGRLSATARALATLTGVQLGVAGAGALVFSVARLGTEYTNLEGRLRPYFDTQRGVNEAMSRIEGIAKRSRAALAPVADLYTKLTASADQFHFSQQRVARVTELATKAATLSGGNQASREAGLYQFSQGISSNRFGGDELRSVLENIPALAQAIAQGLGVTIGQLRQLGAAGALTAKQVTDALLRSSDTIEQRFAKLPLTLSTATTQFTNALTVQVGEFDRAIRLSQILAHTLGFVADNLHGILSGATAIGVTFAAIRVGRWVQDLADGARETAQLQRGFDQITIAVKQQAIAEAEAAAARTAEAEKALTESAERITAIKAEIAQQIQLRRSSTAIIQQGPLSGAVPVSSFSGGNARSTLQGARITEQKAINQLAVLNADLARAEQAEAAAAGVATAAAARNAAAQAELNTVQSVGLGKTGLLSSAMGLFKGSLPTAAVLLAVSAIVYLATAESDAERATKSATKAMEDYGSIIDDTTGKVRDLSRAERERVKKNAEEAIRKYNTGDPGATGLKANAGEALSTSLLRSTRAYNLPGSQVTADDRARFQVVEPFAKDLAKNGDTAVAALLKIREAARNGDKDFQAWIISNRDLIGRLLDLNSAAKESTKSLDALKGATDPAFTERKAQEAADIAAGVARASRETKRLVADANTADDHARYSSNLDATYKRFGIPSPADIDDIREHITALRRQPIEGGQEHARAKAIEGLNGDLTTAIGLNAKYKDTVEQAAHALTRAQTAERDRNRQISADSKEERDQIAQEKANAAARLNNALLDLEKIRPSLTPQEYIRAQGELLKIYDSQIDALNSRSNSSQRAETQAIAAARAINQAQQQFEQRRGDILGRYTDEPKAVQRGGADIRALEEAQQKLGEGIYPRDKLRQDIALIQDGLERPFREMVKDADRNRAIELLTLQGRTAEVVALRQAYELQDQTGQVTQEQYEYLVRNADQEERINDLLASRERVVSALTGSVDDVRQSLEQLIVQAHNNAPAAAKNFIKQIQQNFYQVEARGLVERLTAGADEKVRALISGRNAVDSASRYFASQIGATSSHVLTLGQASQTTAQTMVAAATDFSTRIAAIIQSMQTPQLGTSGGAPVAGGIAGTAAAIADQVISRREHMQSPLTGDHVVTSSFSSRVNPITGKDEFHTGLDIAAAVGTAVHAAFSGRVKTAGEKGGYGNAVVVDSGNGLTTLYGHLSKLNVTLGQIVRQGQVLGQVGSTGLSTGPHLHFGTYENGRAVDPNSVLSSLVSLRTPGTGAAAAPGIGSRLQDLSGIVAGLQEPTSLLDQIKQVDLSRFEGPDTSHVLTQLGGLSTGQLQQAAANNGYLPAPNLPSARSAYNEIGKTVGSSLGGLFDKTFGTKAAPFFGNIGAKFGDALQGAGEGAIASGFAKALGIKQSQTGAQIGGAIGGLLPIPGGAIIGGLIGGTLGGLLKKPKQGGATISLDQYGNVSAAASSGNDAASKGNATGLASSVAGSLKQIADQLGGSLTGAIGSVSLGYRASDKKQPFRVDTTGQGRATGNGVLAFATEQEAINKAIQLMVEKGVVGGISAASQRILASGQDLQAAIEKATLIESIPKRLLQRTNPVAYAVQQLNDEFGKMISALKEGGATVQQFQDAAKLYDLERADAVKDATQQTVSALDDFLRQMTNSDASPLSKRTVYNNAKAAFTDLQAKVTAGQTVDQSDLLNAAKDFEDASRTLKGSTGSFFQDFDAIFATLTKAKDQVTSSSSTINPGDLPASPFTTDPQVAQLLSQSTGAQVSAIDNQTDVLGGKLDDILTTLQQGGSTGDGSSISYLPGFSGGGGYLSNQQYADLNL